MGADVRCDVRGCHAPTVGIDHLFAGYGFCVQFCAEHCPREVDGTECDDHDDHIVRGEE